MARFGCILIVVAMLAGCAAGGRGLDASDLLRRGGEKLGLISSYELIKHDFDSGYIMRARERALAMDKADANYVAAQALLKSRIEPARRRVFLHYLRKARQLERNKQWSQSMGAYDQARAVTIKPEIMQAKQDEMALKVRQLRLDRLIMHRRMQDRLLLDQARGYIAPRGLDANDEVYARVREHYESYLDERATKSLREARYELRKGLPEMGYIEVESYLRMQPDASEGKLLRNEIVHAMPKGLHIPPLQPHTAQQSERMRGQQFGQKDVSQAQVLAAEKQGALVKALLLAQQYRRHGGHDAAALLLRIKGKAAARATVLFAKGSKAFHLEHLDAAIDNWQQAVDLKPDEPEYVEALHRARQLQDRLRVLREGNNRQGDSNDVSERE
ncbi:MAG: 4-hydroxy-3-methylbut-2-en-1-yl diphosphate synthase [Mariprofundus sp.]